MHLSTFQSCLSYRNRTIIKSVLVIPKDKNLEHIWFGYFVYFMVYLMLKPFLSKDSDGTIQPIAAGDKGV